MPAAVVVLDADLRIDHIDGKGFEAHGLDVSEWRGCALPQVLTPYMRRELLPHVHQALEGEPQAFHYVSRDGSRTYAVQLAPIRDPSGCVGSIVATGQDVTEQLRLAAEAARNRDRLHESERLVGVGSWELDLLTDQITFSPGFAWLLGISEDAPLTRASYRARVHPEDRTKLAEAERSCRLTRASTCEHRIIRPGGEIRLLNLRAEMTTDPIGASVMRGAVLDITDQRAQEHRRRNAEEHFREAFDAAPIGMALSDPHTGRYLRVNDALCRMLGRPRAELLEIRIETISHAEDDQPVQAAVAEILAGERTEFRQEKRYIRPDGSQVWGLLHLSPMRGPDGAVTALHSQVIDVTDRKLREARLEEEVADAVWLGRLRDALDQDRLELFSQPIVDLLTGETVQNELLLRMREEDGAIITPGTFLPVAERYGLISEIDRWVVRRAAQIAASGVPAEFNLSGRSVADPAILIELEAAIAEFGADPGHLVVEITETALMAASQAGRDFANRVRELGCRVALDDFGTGFSSLSYLKHLPADYLKIDIDFVRELADSETDARVVRGIVGLAREFHQVTVAEGVENEATLLKLRELGVDLAQGYLLGVPAPFAGGSTERAAPASVADRGPSGAGAADPGGDPVELAREAFAAFGARDVEQLLARCSEDVVVRLAGTSRRIGRDQPYRGRSGVAQYMADVAELWDSLVVTPLTFRPTPGGVIVFGEVQAARANERVRGTGMWVVRTRGDRITSIELFQEAG